MPATRKLTPELVLQIQAEYLTGAGSVAMKDIAARHEVSITALRRERRKMGLAHCDGPRCPKPGSNRGGGVLQFRPDHDALARWDTRIVPGWLTHGEVRG